MKLVRVSKASIATYGVLMQGDIPFALTLERPWLDNQPNVSCIPAGKYECQRVDSPHFGNTFQVMNVPGRSHILFHKGNVATDSEGCILIGESFNPVLGKPGITRSGDGFAEFLSILRMTDRFPLEIVEVS